MFVDSRISSSNISKVSSRQINSGVMPVYGYVPSGMTEGQWKQIQKKELDERKKLNLGGVGPRGFKSRSFDSFQRDLEAGKVDHAMPVFNAKEKLARKEIKLEDIPYMQRGGNWDNSDVKGAKIL